MQVVGVSQCLDLTVADQAMIYLEHATPWPPRFLMIADLFLVKTKHSEHRTVLNLDLGFFVDVKFHIHRL